MNFKSLPIPSLLPLLFVLKLFVSVYVRHVISNPDLFYQTCGNRFSCGSIFEIGYPFRGYDDPIYCGYPGLVLSCDENNITTIEIMDIKYRVLAIHQATQTMRIAREDVMEAICPDLVNTTLENSLFDYATSYTNVTFLYGCPVSSSFPGRNLLSCGTSGNGGVYVLPGAQGPGNCNSSVIVPVLKTGAGNSVNSTTSLNQVMREGFDVRWKINSQDCSDCIASEGQCGYDFAANHTTCFCPNPPYTSVTCTIADGSAPVSRPSSGLTGIE